MTAHWIEVKEEKWSLQSEVVGFQPVSGDHSSWNLGRYFMGLCDCVGICNKDGSKVCHEADINLLIKIRLMHLSSSLLPWTTLQTITPLVKRSSPYMLGDHMRCGKQMRISYRKHTISAFNVTTLILESIISEMLQACCQHR